MTGWFLVDTQGVRLAGPFDSKKKAEANEKRLHGYVVKLNYYPRTPGHVAVPRSAVWTPEELTLP